MGEDTKLQIAIERAKNLLRKRKEILSLPPEKAIDAILDFPQPAALVHSCSEEDLYFLIQEIGPEDSFSLLSLASNRQWEYIMDMEVWDRDRIEIKSFTRWLDLFFRADPDRLIKLLIKEKIEFIEFYLFNTLEVRIREHDEDPSVFGKEFFTFDDTFYIRFIDDSSEMESAGSFKEHREEFLSKFLKRLAAFDHISFQNILLESLGILPAEFEEEAYRLRNVRLAEKGFLPFDEAIGIYQSLTLKDFDNAGKKFISRKIEDHLLLPVPIYSTGMLKEDNLFARALQLIGTDDVLQQIQTEFAGLCNQIISADQNRIRGKEELRPIVKKACGYISIGLQRLAKGDKENKEIHDAVHNAELLQRYPLCSIFRLGYGLALELKWKAERWHKKSWFVSQGLPLGFWGEEWLGVLGGLMLKKPLYYDNYKTGVLYREFLSTGEIQEAEDVLNEIIAFDDLLSLIAIRVEPLAHRFVTHKMLILTFWARHYLGLPEEFLPLALDEFKRFFNDFWTGNLKSRRIQISMKESFLNWLSDKTGLTFYEISQRLGQTLENLFNEMESEYRGVSTKDLDPRYTNLFLLE